MDLFINIKFELLKNKLIIILVNNVLYSLIKYYMNIKVNKYNVMDMNKLENFLNGLLISNDLLLEMNYVYFLND